MVSVDTENLSARSTDVIMWHRGPPASQT